MSTTGRLRRTEHTGSNRCWPCTVVNLLVLAALVAALAPFRPRLAVVVGVAGAAVVWLRGYLVPYTPRFAPALAARLPGNVFGHSPRSGSLKDVGDAGTDPEEVLASLVAADVVAADGGRVELREGAATAWQARMDELAGAPERLAAAAERDVDGVESARVETADSTTYLVATGASTAWIPEPLALAEVAAVQVLADTDLPAAQRGLGAHALCAFLDTCPACGGDVAEGAADDCCGHTVPDPGHEPPTVLACGRCGVAFYTLDRGDERAA